MINPVQKRTGAAGFGKPISVLLLLLAVLLFGFVIAYSDFSNTVTLILVPFVLLILVKIFESPKITIYIVVIIGFLANGISRYIKGPPYGLSIDGLLIIAYLAIFFKEFYKRMDWSPAAKDITYLSIIWFGYALFQLVNPEVVSREAWFYTMRGVSLYMLLIVPLILLLYHNYKDFNTFLYLWGIMSLLATAKGFIQANIGVDPWEKAWLDGGGAVTHMLFGKLRVFSFYSDAGQFGASQAQTGVVAAIIFLHTKIKQEKIFFGIVAIAGFYGMFISGTRGAMIVPFAGFFLYLVLIRNVKLVTIGTILGLIVFVFFKFTTIGNGVYAINRMRTAFDPNDKSLQVRLENQQKLKVYLASRPFGGGIGSAGDKAQRWTPSTFLANVATDSWYVMIWAEQGIVGLILHLFILFYILGKGSYIAMFRVRDPALQGKFFALAAGIFGIMAAAYGNGVLGQIPTSMVTYSSMAFLFTAKEISDKYEKGLNLKIEN